MSNFNWFLLFAGVSATADFIAIVRWVKKSKATVSGKWYMRVVEMSVWKLLAVGALGIISVVLSSIGLYKSLVPTSITVTGPVIQSWGMRPPMVGVISVDPSQLLPMAKTHRLLLIGRIQDNSIDRMEDKKIDKSAEYAIRPELSSMELVMDPTMVRTYSLPITTLELFLVAIPNDVRLEQITRLGDVETLGGKIIEHRGLGFQPNLQSPVPTPTPRLQ